MIWAAICAGQLLAARPAAPESITVASARGVRRVAVARDHGFPALAAPSLGGILTLEAPEATEGMVAVRIGGRPFVFVLDAAYFRFAGSVYALAAGPYVARDTLFLPLQFFAEQLPRLDARYRYDARRFRLVEARAVARADAEAAGGAGGAGGADEAPARRAAPAGAGRAAAAPVPGRPRIVALDPGHGGVDLGMTGPLGRSPFLREKDVTLALARDVGRELQAHGVRAVLTRERDTLIALEDRGRIAAAAGATLFVSIHVNAANPGWRDAAGARGFETYFLAEARTEDARRVARMENASVRFETNARAEHGDPMSFILRDLAQNEHLRESSRLAELVQDSLGRVHPGESRGVKQAGFMVLATSYMPAILIETGFGSNPAEARYLVSDSGQRRLARAIAGGILSYLAEYERRVAAGGG